MHLCCMLVRLDHRLQVLSSSNLWQQKAVMCSHLLISCVSGWPVHHQTSGMETFSKEQSEHVYYTDLTKLILLKTKRGGEETRLYLECDQKRDQAKCRALEMYLRISP